MPIVGFGFDKIYGERKEFAKQVKIENNIKITSLKDAKIVIGKDEKVALRVEFDYTVRYEKAGTLQMLGNVLYFDNEEKIKELKDKWKKDEKVPTDFGALIYNFIIVKTTIKALQLEEDLGLPLHISMPKITKKQ
ncbi:hypothetical protein J4230_03850 [Candidatus Woesearchaeota archaeon]|nr:hypothetical protein [Candidatus Woesearchaeota archaeon]